MLNTLVQNRIPSVAAAVVVAAGSVLGMSSFTSAEAYTISGDGFSGGTPGGIPKYQVSGMKEKDWVHLFWPNFPNAETPAGVPNNLKAVGVVIINTLTTNQAKLQVRIDNQSTDPSARITSFGLSFEELVKSRKNNGDINELYPFNLTIEYLPPATNYLPTALKSDIPGFKDVVICATSGNCSGGNSGGIPVNTFDEFFLTVEGSNLFDPNTGITLDAFALKFQTDGGSYELPGRPSAIPTPALLPGLIALGAGVFRKRQQQESAELERLDEG